MTDAAWGFVALGLLLLALAILLARRNRRKGYVSHAMIARWIRAWRSEVVERDRDKFDGAVRKYLGDVSGGIRKAISALSADDTRALIHELLQLEYHRDCARRTIATAYGRERTRPTLPFGRRHHILCESYGTRIAGYRDEVIAADREKFDRLLKQYIGEPLDDIAAKIDGLPETEAFALLFSLMQLKYRPESAGRITAVAKQGGLEKPICESTKPHPERYGIEDMRNEVVAADKEEFETTLKEFLGEPLDHLHERLGLLTGQELADLYVRLMEFRYNHKEQSGAPIMKEKIKYGTAEGSLKGDHK